MSVARTFNPNTQQWEVVAQGAKGEPGGTTWELITGKPDLSLKADLVNGLVPASQIPSVALTKPHAVSDRAEMLALTAQEGDVAVITQGDDKGTYMLSDGDSSVFESWVRLASPDSDVSSVNGQTGTVNLSASNVGAAPEYHMHDARDVWDASGRSVQELLDSHELKVREIDGLKSAKLDKLEVTQDNTGGRVVRRQDDGHIVSANYPSAQQVLDTLKSQPKALASLWAAQQVATDVVTTHTPQVQVVTVMPASPTAGVVYLVTG